MWPGWGGAPRAALALPYSRSLVFPFSQKKRDINAGFWALLGPFWAILGPFQALFYASTFSNTGSTSGRGGVGSPAPHSHFPILVRWFSRFFGSFHRNRTFSPKKGQKCGFWKRPVLQNTCRSAPLLCKKSEPIDATAPAVVQRPTP